MVLRAIGKPFAKNFRDTIGRLFRRLFRVYAHLYSNHFDHICALGIEGERDYFWWGEKVLMLPATVQPT